MLLVCGVKLLERSAVTNPNLNRSLPCKFGGGYSLFLYANYAYKAKYHERCSA
jgi:hypothetical protein